MSRASMLADLALGSITRVSAGVLAASLVACGNDVGDRGIAVFTTRGAVAIEQPLTPDATGATGFVDGWTVSYEKFLMAFHQIKVGDRKGETGAELLGSKFVDQVKPGAKSLVTFHDVPARRWNAVSFVIKPVFLDSVVVTGEQADRDMMARDGYAIFVQGTATKGDVRKRFRWGIKATTVYTDCSVGMGDDALEGITIRDGETETAELSVLGDALFRDRLPAGTGPAVVGNLRFDALAAADQPGAGYGEITMEELSAAPLDRALYDPADQPVTNLAELVTELARTVARFRGDGACTIVPIR